MTKFERLAKALSEVTGEPCFARYLHGSKGWYRQTVADCQPWTGHTGTMEAGGMGHSISCWDTATDCLKFGFKVDIDKSFGSYGYYNVSALDPEKINEIPTEGMVWIPPRKRAGRLHQPEMPQSDG